MPEIHCIEIEWEGEEVRGKRPGVKPRPRPRPVPVPRPPRPRPRPTPVPVPPPPAPIPVPPPVPTPTDVDPAAVLAVINRERVARGLGQLKASPELNRAAHDHTSDMARHNFMDHTGSDGSTLATRLRAAGYPYAWAGEIIAAGYPDEEAVVRGWINSPAHYAIMFSDKYTEFGAGGIARFWTVDFGSRRVTYDLL